MVEVDVAEIHTRLGERRAAENRLAAASNPRHELRERAVKNDVFRPLADDEPLLAKHHGEFFLLVCDDVRKLVHPMFSPCVSHVGRHDPKQETRGIIHDTLK